MTATLRFADPIDATTFGEYRVAASPARRGATATFAGRITADGSSGYLAAPGRYHLYAGRFCPRSHRAAITIALTGLTDAVSMSYVDGLRDGRGWAFRERTGPDPVNGFTLLRQAYESTAPGYDGEATIPVLWDRATGRIVSNDPAIIDVDLATAFAAWSPTGIELYPAGARDRIDDLSRQIAALEQDILLAVYHDADARRDLRARLRQFDRDVATGRFLLGDALTLADIRLWVTLVRYDAGPNANGAAGPKLSSFPDLWAYARELLRIPAFRDTTDFAAFTAPLTPPLDWSEPAVRSAGK